MSADKLKLRCVERIDYKILNSRGEKVIKDSTTPFITMDEEKEVNKDQLEDTYNEVPNSEEDVNSIINNTQNQQLLTRYCVLKDEINDFIDEINL